VKVIGLEVRVGSNAIGREWKREAKVIPLELAIPAPLSTYPWGPDVYLEITAHTSQGDVTARMQLPKDSPRADQYPGPNLNQKLVDEALEELARRVEAMQ